jgi:hypothetical protein
MNKVSASLGFEPEQKLLPPTELDWTQDFKDKIYDKEEKFILKILSPF